MGTVACAAYEWHGESLDRDRAVFVCTREVGAEQDIQMAFVTVSLDHPFCSTKQKKVNP
jgi:hypothetical protein